jgi:hypothetical protein
LAVDIISFLLWSAWIVFASVALARGERAQGVAVARSP